MPARSCQSAQVALQQSPILIGIIALSTIPIVNLQSFFTGTPELSVGPWLISQWMNVVNCQP